MVLVLGVVPLPALESCPQHQAQHQAPGLLSHRRRRAGPAIHYGADELGPEALPPGWVVLCPPQWAVRSTLPARTYVPRTVPCVPCCAGLSCGGPPGGLIVLGSDPILRYRPFHLARRGSPGQPARHSLTHSRP